MLPYYAQDVDVGVRRMPSAHLQRRDYDNDRLAGLANSATWKARISESKTEPSRVSRRLPCLRGWGHDESGWCSSTRRLQGRPFGRKAWVTVLNEKPRIAAESRGRRRKKSVP